MKREGLTWALQPLQPVSNIDQGETQLAMYMYLAGHLRLSPRCVSTVDCWYMAIKIIVSTRQHFTQIVAFSVRIKLLYAIGLCIEYWGSDGYGQHSLYPSLVAKSSTSFGWDKGGNVTSVVESVR